MVETKDSFSLCSSAIEQSSLSHGPTVGKGVSIRIRVPVRNQFHLFVNTKEGTSLFKSEIPRTERASERTSVHSFVGSVHFITLTRGHSRPSAAIGRAFCYFAFDQTLYEYMCVNKFIYIYVCVCL